MDILQIAQTGFGGVISVIALLLVRHILKQSEKLSRMIENHLSTLLETNKKALEAQRDLLVAVRSFKHEFDTHRRKMEKES